jgi:2-dehydropantoate 2-reductase
MTRILVVGVGAVGGYFGARLAAAGADVTFLARGAHADAMRRDGLQLRSAGGDLHIAPVALHAPGATAYDLALLCVKIYDLESVAAALPPLLAAGGAAVPFQNGVEAMAILARHLPSEAVCGGVAYIGGAIEAPGVVRHAGTMAKLVFGERDGDRSARLARLERALLDAGVGGELVVDIETEIWRKFLFLAPFASLTAWARRPIGPLRDNARWWRRFEAMLDEAIAVAAARGVRLPEGLRAERLAFTRDLPATMQSSLLTDLDAGRRLELDWLTGAVLRLGAQAGVPTPVTTEAYAAIAAAAGIGHRMG